MGFLRGDVLRPKFPSWERAETRYLVEALDEALAELTEQEQYDASIDDRGFGPVGSRTELPWEDAFREADITMQDYLDGQHSVTELIAGNNLPPEARGYTLVELRRLVARVAGDEGRVEGREYEDDGPLDGLRGARQTIVLRGAVTPNMIRNAVCDALREVGQLGVNFDGSFADDESGCEQYVRIVVPRNHWDEPVELGTGQEATIVVEVYHEHTGRSGGEPPDDPYLSQHSMKDWDNATELLQANGWDINWDSINAATSAFYFMGPEGVSERYMEEAMARARQSR